MGFKRKYRMSVARPKGATLVGLIFEKIAEAGEALLDSFFPAKYPEARLWRKILGLDASYEFKRATFSSILSQLQAQGLVARRRQSGRNYWRITPLGQKFVADRATAERPRPDGKKRLVCFDIPERERDKRRWLRGELIALGYRPLQKSVWIGETPLPQEFIEDLDALALRTHVHVIPVVADGTLAAT